jgi:pimeloyl-ACP methyl ester carboxylesterase
MPATLWTNAGLNFALTGVGGGAEYEGSAIARSSDLKGENTMKRVNVIAVLSLVVGATVGGCAHQQGSEQLVATDHYVNVRSSIPEIAGQNTRIYVRERSRPARADASKGVVLFVHGAGTPAAVAFDASRPDYSWMAYLAAAGYDTFAMDQTGYGRSTRPAAMEDPCNLPPKQRAEIGHAGDACKPMPPRHLTPITSEWEEIDAVVEYLKKLRGVKRVSLVAWSRGGPRAGGYAALHPDKVERLILLAPAYTRAMPATAPKLPASATLMNIQSRASFIANWDRQVGCANQYEAATLDAVWSDMLSSDPVGSKWGSGVRRAPNTTVWGWTTAVVGKSQTPTLMVAGEHDKQVVPERVEHLYNDLGSSRKVFIQLACSSHNAMWEVNRAHLFRASREWLDSGTVDGKQTGMLRMGY